MTDKIERDMDKRFRNVDRARELAASGDLDEALRVLEGTREGLAALHRMIRATALKAEGALTAIKRGSAEEAHAAALYELAGDLAVRDDFERAIRIAKSIQPEFYRSHALSEISALQAEVGQFEEAFHTLAEIPGAGATSSALSTIAERLAKVGATQKALDLAHQLPSEESRAHACEILGTAFLESGHYESAGQLFKALGADGRAVCHEASARLALVLAKRGEFFRAFKLVREIEDDRVRVKTLQWLEAELLVRRMFAQLEE